MSPLLRRAVVFAVALLAAVIFALGSTAVVGGFKFGTAAPKTPTATPIPPTATPIPPTATPIPPTATKSPTATPTPPPQWQQNTDLQGFQSVAFASDSMTGYACQATLSGVTVEQTSDGGKDWGQDANAPPGAKGKDCAVYVNPTANNDIVVFVSGGDTDNLFRQTSASAQFIPLIAPNTTTQQPLTVTWAGTSLYIAYADAASAPKTTSLAVVPASGGIQNVNDTTGTVFGAKGVPKGSKLISTLYALDSTIFVRFADNIFASSAGGTTWQTVTITGLADDPTIVTTLSDGQTLVAVVVGQGIYSSSDGLTWTKFAAAKPSDPVTGSAVGSVGSTVYMRFSTGIYSLAPPYDASVMWAKVAPPPDGTTFPGFSFLAVSQQNGQVTLWGRDSTGIVSYTVSS